MPKPDIKWIERVAKVGYASKGFLYTAIALLALQAAIVGGQIEGSSGTIKYLAARPFGMFLLVLISFGLIAYTLWRVMELVFNPESRGWGVMGIAKRIMAFTSATLHGTMAYSTIKLLVGVGREAEGNGSTAWLMSEPGGRWGVAAVGVGVLIAGGYQFYKATRRKKIFSNLDKRAMNTKERSLATWSGRLGFVSRGVVWLFVGYFFLHAAITFDAEKTGGLGKALTSIASEPFGGVMLALMAIGLIGYACYCFVRTRYFRLRRA